MIGTQQLCDLHREAAQSIIADKSLLGDADLRANQLVVALRHIICCAVLVETPEADLLDMAHRYGIGK